MEIDKHLSIVKKVYSDDKKVGQMLKEGAIATIQAVTCLDLPSVATCYKKIEEYKYKVVLACCIRQHAQADRENAVKEELQEFRTMASDQKKNDAFTPEIKQAWNVMLGTMTDAHLALMVIGDNKGQEDCSRRSKCRRVERPSSLNLMSGLRKSEKS